MMNESRARRVLALRRVAKAEGIKDDEAFGRVVDAGLRVFLRKHRISCGFPGCQRRCCGRPRGKLALLGKIGTREGQ